ncbi:hypothetical protein [Vibrio parahaemolyticus]|uniref:hypothetical protein n=1 Tax=Vibrio parahaemolyticus TaxID=670 RepID=UPI00226B4394|nr:hypothetical protein [Vibrio parahaemolyticus]MCX8941262.1 hypothetical protein [Vibrio parahaemolyticus]
MKQSPSKRFISLDLCECCRTKNDELKTHIINLETKKLQREMQFMPLHLLTTSGWSFALILLGYILFGN